MRKIEEKSEDVLNMFFSKGINELSVSSSSDFLKKLEAKADTESKIKEEALKKNLI